MTPPHLLGSRLTDSSSARPSIYAELAVPLYDGEEHQAVCLREMLATKGICREAQIRLAGPLLGRSPVPAALSSWLPLPWRSAARRARGRSRKLSSFMGLRPRPAEGEQHVDIDLVSTAEI